MRKSGEPYITHPRRRRADSRGARHRPAKTVAAALLHDTVEDTEYTLDQLRADFGDEVALLVDGVTKLDKLKYGDTAQAETVRKMVIAMSKDMRVLSSSSPTACTTRAPGASCPRRASPAEGEGDPRDLRARSRTGSASRRSSSSSRTCRSRCCYPKLYLEIESPRASAHPAARGVRAEVIDARSRRPEGRQDPGKVAGRPKQYYSIYQKMIVRGREFDEIYDLMGIRVLVNSRPRLLRRARGRSTRAGTPVPGRFKDYIATPKFNLYQSLHTTVLGPEGRPVEIQIRTHEMHQRAEFGVAAHWKYKEQLQAGRRPRPGAARRATWRGSRTSPTGRARPRTRRSSSRACASRSARRRSTSSRRKGKVIGLPAGATPGRLRLRRAHDVGHRTMGAKVNGRLVPLDSALASGDVGRGLHLEEPRLGPQQGLAAVRPQPEGPREDPAVVHQGAPRRGDRAGQGRHRPRDAQAEPAAAEADEPGGARRHRDLDALRGRVGALRGDRRGPRVDAVGDRAGARAGAGHAGGGRARVRVADDGAPAALIAHQRLRRARSRRARHPGEAREVLHPGAGRRDRRLRDPRVRASRCTAATATT